MSSPTSLRAATARDLPLRCALWVAVVVLAAMAHAEVDFGRLEALALERYGEPAVETVKQWRALLETSAGASDADKLRLANTFFNERVRFVDDEVVWGERDYWATPLEVMGRRQGDCEDFSVAKYATLLLLNVPLDKLRLVYVKAVFGGPTSRVTRAHMVVAYYADPESPPLILDNLIPEILPATQRPDLAPVFSFNSAGLWVGQAARPADTQPGERLSRWRRVLQRMQAEGLR